jgi:hypothetical protein
VGTDGHRGRGPDGADEHTRAGSRRDVCRAGAGWPVLRCHGCGPTPAWRPQC